MKRPVLPPFKILCFKALSTFVVLIFCTYSVFAQMPINRFIYKVKKSDFVTTSETCKVENSVLDTFFKIEKGNDEEIIGNVLSTQIDTWKNSLANIEGVEPFLACYEAALIKSLKARIISLRQNKVSNYSSRPIPNISTTHTNELQKLSFYINQLDTLHKEYSGINRILGTPKIKYRFIPARNRIEASLMYQKYGTRFLQVGQNISLYGWENRGTINPEVISFFAGPLRIALNTLVSSDGNSDSTDLTEIAKLRTLTGNGGNIVASVYFPIYHTTSPNIQTLLQLSPKFATEAPILGSPFETDTMYANGNLGLDFNFSVNLQLFGKSSFYIYVRPAYIIGSRPYRESLKIEDNFFLTQSTVGIDITNVARIGFALPPITNVKSLKSNTFLLSLQLSPQNALK